MITMRKKREWYENATYHIMGRGVHRCTIFYDEGDYENFMYILQQIKKKYPFDLHAFCLMTNHFHLQISTRLDPIWNIMKSLMRNYAMTFNQKHDFRGHLFEARYNSCIIKRDDYFLEVSRYIHLNPVKACIVKNPLDYPYSSYGKYITDLGDYPSRRYSYLADTTRVFTYFGSDARNEYKNFVEGTDPHTDTETMIQNDIGEDEMWLPR